MNNPLIQKIDTKTQNPVGRIRYLMQTLRSGNSQQIAQNLMQQNPQFRAFMEANRGKSPQQVAQEYGVDLGQLMKQM